MKLQEPFDRSMLNGFVTMDQLVDAIKAATVTIKVHIPSQDYYARPGEAETESLTYVSPHKMLAALKPKDDSDV